MQNIRFDKDMAFYNCLPNGSQYGDLQMIRNVSINCTISAGAAGDQNASIDTIYDRQRWEHLISTNQISIVNPLQRYDGGKFEYVARNS